MSLLIKGMEMPKNGNETILRIQPDGTVLDQYGHHLLLAAAPVPPHGRLIDADAYEFPGDLKYEPTIIPASGGKEDE